MTPNGWATVIAPLNRLDRAAARLIRERERKGRPEGGRRATRAQAEAYEALVEKLTKAHQIRIERVDWDDIVETGQVAPGVARDAVSQAARRKLAGYRPSMVDNLLGREREIRRRLTSDVINAAKADAELYGRARAAADEHNRMLKLAPDIRALKPASLATVLQPRCEAALADLVEGMGIHVGPGGRLIAFIDLLEFDALPDEACKAPPAGAASHAPLSLAERCELQLANACAAVLRAALEVVQVAQVETLEVVARLCRPGGMTDQDKDVVLHVKIATKALSKLDLTKLDAASVVTTLGARLDWNVVRGLAPIRTEDLGLPGQKPPLAA